MFWSRRTLHLLIILLHYYPLLIYSSFYSFTSKGYKYPTLYLVEKLCWSSSNPQIFTVHSPHQEPQPLPPTPIFTSFKFQHSPISWDSMNKEANIFINGTTSFVFTYQCAFQHVTREFLPHIPFIYGLHSEIKTSVDQVFFFQHAPCYLTPTWITDLISNITNDIRNPIKFLNLSKPCLRVSEAFSSTSACKPFIELNQPQHTCLPNTNWSFCANAISFSNHFWYFDQQSSHSVRKAVLGNAIYHRADHICLNQRVGTREIVNLKAVHELLLAIYSKYPVKVYSYEGRSFLEQAHLVNRCKLILHPHSGGETNFIFLHPGSIVIEFFAKNYQPVSYFGDLVTSSGSTHIPIILEDVQLPAGCERYRDNTTDCVGFPASFTPCTSCYKDAKLIVDLKRLRTILQDIKL